MTAAVALVVVGGAVAFFSVIRIANDTYRVSVDAPEGVTWGLWVPKSSVDTSLVFDGGIRSFGVVETPYGLMNNISGTGSGSVNGAATRLVASLDPWSWRPGTDVVLSGHQSGGGFWFRRSSNAPSANITAFGVAYVHIAYIGSDIGCGQAFGGELQEGWTLTSPLIGDCLIWMGPIPWLYVVAPAFLVAGFVLLRKALRRRRDSLAAAVPG